MTWGQRIKVPLAFNMLSCAFSWQAHDKGDKNRHLLGIWVRGEGYPELTREMFGWKVTLRSNCHNKLQRSRSSLVLLGG